MIKYKIIIPLFILLIGALILDTQVKPFNSLPKLFWAIIAKQPSTTRALLNAGANPNQTLTNGTSALIIASASGNDTIVSLPLAHHAKINTRNYDGNIALLAAAGSGNSDIALVLIAHGADPCQRSKRGLLPFQVALKWGNHQSARRLRHTCIKKRGAQQWNGIYLSSLPLYSFFQVIMPRYYHTSTHTLLSLGPWG